MIPKQTSNSLVSGFNSTSPWVLGLAAAARGRIRGRPLTLSTDGPLPAFFADAGEGVAAVNHTGASVMAGAWQTATVSGYKTKAGYNHPLLEDPRWSEMART